MEIITAFEEERGNRLPEYKRGRFQEKEVDLAKLTAPCLEAIREYIDSRVIERTPKRGMLIEILKDFGKGSEDKEWRKGRILHAGRLANQERLTWELVVELEDGERDVCYYPHPTGGILLIESNDRKSVTSDKSEKEENPLRMEVDDEQYDIDERFDSNSVVAISSQSS